MEQISLQVGLYEVNCTILVRDGNALVIDPGSDADRIASTLAQMKVIPSAILLTHAHFDHIGGIPGLTEKFKDLPVLVSRADAKVVTHPMNQLPPDYPPITLPSTFVALEDRLSLKVFAPDGVWQDLTVIETPGHTPGGVCYLFAADNLLLSGDTLFAGSVGRTDFPGGDFNELERSLKKLAALPPDTKVIPGHGPFTTIGAEKRGNPFLCSVRGE